jgi:hypothetical protein
MGQYRIIIARLTRILSRLRSDIARVDTPAYYTHIRR